MLAKSAEKLGTPVKMELDKLRQVAEERAANCNKGLASVLGISEAATVSGMTAFSSPLSRSVDHRSTVQCPMSAVSFRPGMSVYRPGSGSKVASVEHCPPTPSLIDGKRSRLSLDRETKSLGSRFTEALISNENNSNVNTATIPFSPARAQGLNLIERETCPKKLSSRQKQIDYGKNTTGYALYTAQIPRNQRKRGDHPWTPNKHQICSKRSWDGQVRKWRRALHKFDPDCTDSVESEGSAESVEGMESEESIEGKSL